MQGRLTAYVTAWVVGFLGPNIHDHQDHHLSAILGLPTALHQRTLRRGLEYSEPLLESAE